MILKVVKPQVHPDIPADFMNELRSRYLQFNLQEVTVGSESMYVLFFTEMSDYVESLDLQQELMKKTKSHVQLNNFLKFFIKII